MEENFKKCFVLEEVSIRAYNENSEIKGVFGSMESLCKFVADDSHMDIEEVKADFMTVGKVIPEDYKVTEVKYYG